MFDILTQPHLIVYFLVKAILVWFFIILVFAPVKYKLSSLIIVLFILINIAFIGKPIQYDGSSDYYMQYFKNKEFLILLDGATAMALTMVLRLDKQAAIQAVIISFAILCHTMILFDYKLSLSHYETTHIFRIVTGFFYNWYEEMIVTTLISQMAASHDGFTGALRNVQALLFRVFIYINGSCKGLLPQKKREAKT